MHKSVRSFSDLLARSVSSYDEIDKRLTRSYPEQFHCLVRNVQDIQRKLSSDPSSAKLADLLERQTNKLVLLANELARGSYYPVTRSIARMPSDPSHKPSKLRSISNEVDRTASLPRASAAIPRGFEPDDM